MIHYTCPRCKKSLESPVSFAGQKMNCPDCNQRLQIPQPSTPPAAPPLNKTILASEEPPAGPSSPPTVESAGNIPVVHLGKPLREPAPARRESCLECGIDISQRQRVQTCPDCSAVLCSSGCYREHRYQTHAPARKSRPRREECDRCGSTARPYRTQVITEGGWILFAVLLVFFFPLCWIGLLMTETEWRCADCRARLD